MTDPDRPMDPTLLADNHRPLAGYQAKHFLWSAEGDVTTVTPSRSKCKNPLTFDSYAELRDLFHQLKWVGDVKAIVLAGAGNNSCSGGDVHEIIGPLVQLKAPRLPTFTRMTGELVKTIRACPQPIVATINDICTGVGAILTMTLDLRLGTVRSKTAFLFNRVGLTGCDIGACAVLSRIIGQGRASELLYTGRLMSDEEGERWGFFNRLCEPAEVLSQAYALAVDLAAGPAFANGITKTMLHQEWTMVIEQVIKAEVQAQTICVLTENFSRAYHAFVARQKPVFGGN